MNSILIGFSASWAKAWLVKKKVGIAAEIKEITSDLNLKPLFFLMLVTLCSSLGLSLIVSESWSCRDQFKFDFNVVVIGFFTEQRTIARRSRFAAFIGNSKLMISPIKIAPGCICI